MKNLNKIITFLAILCPWIYLVTAIAKVKTTSAAPTTDAPIVVTVEEEAIKADSFADLEKVNDDLFGFDREMEIQQAASKEEESHAPLTPLPVIQQPMKFPGAPNYAEIKKTTSSPIIKKKPSPPAAKKKPFQNLFRRSNNSGRRACPT